MSAVKAVTFSQMGFGYRTVAKEPKKL